MTIHVNKIPKFPTTAVLRDVINGLEWHNKSYSLYVLVMFIATKGRRNTWEAHSSISEI